MEVLGPKKETEKVNNERKKTYPLLFPFGGIDSQHYRKKMKVVSVTFVEEKMEKELHI